MTSPPTPADRCQALAQSLRNQLNETTPVRRSPVADELGLDVVIASAAALKATHQARTPEDFERAFRLLLAAVDLLRASQRIVNVAPGLH